MPNSAEPLPIVGYWTPNTEFGKLEQRWKSILLISTICLIVAIMMLANAGLMSGAILPLLGMSGLYHEPILRRLLRRTIKRKAEANGPSYQINIKLYREGGLHEHDQGLTWFEGRLLHFLGRGCEFAFDAGRIRPQQRMVESIPFSYRIREIEIAGEPLYLDIQITEAYGVELAKGELVSFDDMVREACSAHIEASTQEIFPPITSRPVPTFADPAYMVGVWFGLALLCAIVSVWVWISKCSPTVFLSGPFGVLAFAGLGVLTIRQRRRFLCATKMVSTVNQDPSELPSASSVR